MVGLGGQPPRGCGIFFWMKTEGRNMIPSIYLTNYMIPPLTPLLHGFNDFWPPPSVDHQKKTKQNKSDLSIILYTPFIWNALYLMNLFCLQPIQVATVVVIHPGSLNLRIGRASDTFPVTLPHCLARRKKDLSAPDIPSPWMIRAESNVKFIYLFFIILPVYLLC